MVINKVDFVKHALLNALNVTETFHFNAQIAIPATFYFNLVAKVLA